MIEIVSLVLNLVLGGGLIVTLSTLKATRSKASHEARGAELENDEKAAQIAFKYIIEPLKKELNALRKETRRLQRAIEKIGECEHIAHCPVRGELHHIEEREAQGGGSGEGDAAGQVCAGEGA